MLQQIKICCNSHFLWLHREQFWTKNKHTHLDNHEIQTYIVTFSFVPVHVQYTKITKSSNTRIWIVISEVYFCTHCNEILLNATVKTFFIAALNKYTSCGCNYNPSKYVKIVIINISVPEDGISSIQLSLQCYRSKMIFIF